MRARIDGMIRTSLLVSILVAGAGCAGWAQAGVDGAVPGKRPMTFADLQQMKRVGDPQISPSGKWAMFSVVEVDLQKNSKVSHLWVVPLAGSAPEKEKQITFWKEGESGGRFSPDGKQILFVANDSATGLSQIYLAAWDEATGTVGTPQRLTSVSTEADGPIWSPNSKRILFTSRVYPECSDEETWIEEDACDKRNDDAAAANPVKAQIWDHLLYRHWDHYVGIKRSHLLVVSAVDGNAVRDLTPRREIGDAEAPVFSLGGPLGYAWAPGSEEVAFVTNLDLIPAASTNNDVFTLLLDDPGARPRKISTSLGGDDAPAYSSDGKYLAFRSQARAGYESDRFRLMVFDRLAGTTKELMPRFDRWVDELAWGRDSKTIYFASGESGEENILSVALGESEPIPVATGAEYGDLQIAPDGKTIVATSMTVRRPAEVVAIVPGGRLRGTTGAQEGAITAITHQNDGLLARLELPLMDSFEFAGAMNTKVQGFVIRPPNFDASRKYSVKFLIHGGPQGAWGDAWSYRWNPELMAASGYVVVMVNPRGSTGYGQAFIDGVNGDWGGKPYIDLMKGLDYAEQHYAFIDKTRECALGASYGGYMADWILTHTDRFACIVTHDGMFNPQSAYGTTEELWFNEWEFRRPAGATKTRASDAAEEPGQPWRYSSGPIADDPFRKWSPMLSVQNAKTPTLVIHSQRDYRLDVSEGFQLFTALQRLNVPSRMLYFPDEGHWILKPQNSRLWYEQVGAWCDRWTKNDGYGAAEPPRKPVPAPARRKTETPPEIPAKARTPERTPPERTPERAPVVPPVASATPQPQVETSPAPSAAGASFSIAISIPQSTIQPGQDIPVTITMTNVSNHQVLFPHKPGHENGELSFDVEVKDEAGKRVPETPYGREAQTAGRRREEARTVDYLQPGGIEVQTVHLEKIVNFSHPGTYTVEVSCDDSLIDVVVRSNTVKLTIGRKR